MSAIFRSTPLRKTNWIVPCELARSIFWESSGVSKSVTTLTVCGLPCGSGSIDVPVVMTSTSCSTVWVIVPEGNAYVAMTSTWEPGKRNPATPTISFERIAVARIPSGILPERPKPDPGAARSRANKGCLAVAETMRGRPMASSTFLIEPGNVTLSGQAIVVRSCAVNGTPGDRSLAAATIEIILGPEGGGCNRLATTYVAPPAITAAITKAIKIRRRSVNHPHENVRLKQYKVPMAIAGAKGILIE